MVDITKKEVNESVGSQDMLIDEIIARIRQLGGAREKG
jgi:hypothetical protein